MRKPFGYLRPASVAEALEMKAEHGPAARYWAGGTDLMLQWRRGEVEIAQCIDLTGLDGLAGIDERSGAIRIGALASLDALDHAALLDRHQTGVPATARLMCTKQTRTIATVGGNMCNASPGADLSPLFVALDAKAVIRTFEGQGDVPMEEFFTGVNRTVLDGEALLTAIVVPLPAARRAASYRRVARTVVDIALVSSAVSVTVAEGVITDARIALGSVAPVPVRVRKGEELLAGRTAADDLAEAIDEAGALAEEAAQPISDVRAGASYRRRMCGVLTRRALRDVLSRTRGEGA